MSLQSSGMLPTMFLEKLHARQRTVVAMLMIPSILWRFPGGKAKTVVFFIILFAFELRVIRVTIPNLLSLPRNYVRWKDQVSSNLNV
jgi:hypothetical protein